MSGIFFSNRQRRGADIGGGYLAEHALARQGNGERTAAGAKVKDLPVGLARNFSQREVDEQFGLGPRHQCGRVDDQLVRPELFGTHDVSHRLAIRTTLQQRSESLE